MLRTYNALLLPVRAVGAAWSRWRALDRSAATEWHERWARSVPDAPRGGWWLHGASLGEARLVSALASAVRARRPERPVYASAVTRTGRAALPGPPLADASFFAPLDFRGLPGRVLDALDPSGLSLVETELWPNLVHEAGVRGVPVAIVNGRLSEERMSRYRRWSLLYREVLGGIAWIGAQSEADAERFASLGVDPRRLAVTGNLKYDLPRDTIDREAVLGRIGLAPGDAPVVVAGSTADGEDAIVLDAFERCRRQHPPTRLVLAPRHLARVDAAEAACGERGFRAVRLSEVPPATLAGHDVLLVDTTGELARLYAAADVAFVGGSLVPVGGHNVLEPVVAGVPVLFGTHTGHVREPAQALLDAGAATRVADGEGLARAWVALLGDRGARERMIERGRAVLERGRGSLERTLDGLEAAFDRPGPR
jgi:3-deoxy-D-manno-octulosonic-acid transferase